jgi:hypothetical protein
LGGRQTTLGEESMHQCVQLRELCAEVGAFTVVCALRVLEAVCERS